MRVIECNECGEVLSAANDEELTEAYMEHMADEHGEEPLEETAAEVIAEGAYDAGDA